MSFGYLDLSDDDSDRYHHHYPPGLRMDDLVAAARALDAAQESGALLPKTVVTISKG